MNAQSISAREAAGLIASGEAVLMNRSKLSVPNFSVGENEMEGALSPINSFVISSLKKEVSEPISAQIKGPRRLIFSGVIGMTGTQAWVVVSFS